MSRDPWVRVGAGVLILHAVLTLVPILDQKTYRFISIHVLPLAGQTLVLLTCLRTWRRLERAEERFFWGDLTVAAGVWLALLLPQIGYGLIDAPSPSFLRPVGELLLAVLYLALALAVEGEPHRRQRWRSERGERRLVWPSVALLVGGLYAYFVLVPFFWNPEEYHSDTSSTWLFMALDAYIAVRFTVLTGRTESPPYRRVYGLMALAFLGFLFHGVWDIASSVGHLPSIFETPWAALLAWPHFLWLLAARWRFASTEPTGGKRTSERLEENLSGPSGRTMLTALTLPFIHFAAVALGHLDRASQDPRELLLAVVLLAFGALAWIQHRWSEKWIGDLWDEHQRLLETLRYSGQDLRLMVERRHADATLRASRERFSKVFDKNPDAISILSADEGRILEVNARFVRTVGMSRDALVGQVAKELGIWADEEERTAVREEIFEKGFVRDRRIHFRTANGEVRTALLAGDAIEFSGRPAILFTAYDATERQRAEEAFERRDAFLSASASTIVAFAEDGRVLFWNRAAERRFGYPEEEILGHPLAPHLGVEGSMAWSEALREARASGEFRGELELMGRPGDVSRETASILPLKPAPRHGEGSADGGGAYLLLLEPPTAHGPGDGDPMLG